MDPNNLESSGDAVNNTNVSGQNPNFTLEEITDRKMGLIQCCCASNAGTINLDDVI